jgi:hypothetical protein
MRRISLTAQKTTKILNATFNFVRLQASQTPFFLGSLEPYPTEETQV